MFDTITMRFKSIKAWREKSGKCPICGKRVLRKTTFECTVNPFNRNKDGFIKSETEVRRDVNIEADKWVPDFTHEKCKEKLITGKNSHGLGKNGAQINRK